MKQIELLSPAGSPDAVRAAVQSGAGAVYMGFGKINARRNAVGFSREEMAQAIAYCRAHDVKTNITFNIVITDREYEEALDDARFLYEAGADAFIVQDLGIARMLHHYAPDMELHASTQMTIHSVEGAKFAKSIGFSRVVLSRECTLDQIRHITAEAGIETEVFVHGALCMCYSGQCYMSSVIGSRSGNRGMCAQPCRLGYTYDNNRRGCPLSLKDLCLAGWLEELRQAGVASLKIEGRMKRPEYTAVVTQVYADLLREHREPTREEMIMLQKVFSRDGFTDGYLTGRKGDDMFGTKTDVPLDEVQEIYDEAAKRFVQGKERQSIPLTFAFIADIGGLYLRVCDTQQHEIEVTDLEPVEYAENRPTTVEMVKKSLSKTGGTMFYPATIDVSMPEGLMIPSSRLNALRREALGKLSEYWDNKPIRTWNEEPLPRFVTKVREFQGYIFEVRELEQVTFSLLQLKPQAVYVPLTELAGNLERTEQLTQVCSIAAVLPRICTDKEWEAVCTLLQAVQQVGVYSVVVGNVAHITPARMLGFYVIGDFGLNVTNSEALTQLALCGVSRQTLSFELRLAQMRDLEKCMDTECIIYGYLPLMIFENCAIRRKSGRCTCDKKCTLMDRTHRKFRLLPEYGCRNTLLNSQPLLLDNIEAYEDIGVPYARLRFTIESPKRCAQIADAIIHQEPLQIPGGITRGLYYRGVE